MQMEDNGIDLPLPGCASERWERLVRLWDLQMWVSWPLRSWGLDQHDSALA